MADVLEELEELLAEAREGQGAAEEIDPLDELDALLAEGKEAQREERRVKEARERVKRGGQSLKEREADLERIAKWELVHEWEARANVLVLEDRKCERCGAVSSSVEQLMTRQVHRYKAGTTRFQKVERFVLDLPREVVVRKAAAPMCMVCAAEAGFALGTPNEIWENWHG